MMLTAAASAPRPGRRRRPRRSRATARRNRRTPPRLSCHLQAPFRPSRLGAPVPTIPCRAKAKMGRLRQLTDAPGPCDQLRRWCSAGRTAAGPKREHGADDPKGAKTVTAPATVSGEGRRQKSLGNREDGRQPLDPRVRRPATKRTVQAVQSHLEHARRVLPLMTTAPISTTSIAIFDRQMAAGVVCLFLGLGLVAGVGFAGPDRSTTPPTTPATPSAFPVIREASNDQASSARRGPCRDRGRAGHVGVQHWRVTPLILQAESLRGRTFP
jgi:hypothetical protein